MRDDISKLNMPNAAKQYARRGGLKSMMRQPKDSTHVNAILSNPGKPNVFKTRDAVGKVKHAWKAKEAIEALNRASRS